MLCITAFIIGAAPIIIWSVWTTEKRKQRIAKDWPPGTETWADPIGEAKAKSIREIF